MQPNQNQPAGGGITPADIYYVLFRRKWLIGSFAGVGLIVAVIFFKISSPAYISEAELMVRYVTDPKAPKGLNDDAPVQRPGYDIVTTEIEIMQTLDLARNVAEMVGVEKILGKTSTNVDMAAAIIKKGLVVESPKKGNVIHVTFQHSKPELVEPVLRQVIDSYFKAHKDAHGRSAEMENLWRTETDQTKGLLAETEERLRKIKTTNNIESVEENKRLLFAEQSSLRMERSQAVTELAERKAGIEELEKQGGKTNSVAATKDQEKQDSEAEAATPVLQKPPLDKMNEYARISKRYEAMWEQKEAMLAQVSGEHMLAKAAEQQIAIVQKQKKKLEEEYPWFLEQPSATTAGGDRKGLDYAATGPAVGDLSGARIRVKELNARIKQLDEQLDDNKKQMASIDEVAQQITEWERTRKMLEQKLTYFVTTLEQNKLDQALASANTSNIKVIQYPSPPLRDSSDIKKRMLISAGGGIGLGLGLAFLLEMLLNQSVRRPAEITSNYRLPLFLSIPEFVRNGKRKRLKATEPNGEEDGNGQMALEPIGANGKAVAPWEESHDLHPYSEALRDRLVTFFEIRNMTHRPKLIAVTSCGRGAGVTSVAAGLAASLSETGEGNVLLVDMNEEQGAAHPFYKGKPALGLEEVLAVEKRGPAKVNDKLYLVSGSGMEGDERLPRILPKRFTHLLPKLQASDYDYIIFDMPPVTQTSVTPRLAGLMDVVLLLVEADKTHRNVLKHASALLAETKTDVGVVLNRRKTYIPQWLHQEF